MSHSSIAESDNHALQAAHQIHDKFLGLGFLQFHSGSTFLTNVCVCVFHGNNLTYKKNSSAYHIQVLAGKKGMLHTS